MNILDTAARGFEADSDAYERGRPSYPAEAVSCLVEEFGIGPSTTVVDLAAGTGKLGRLLVPAGARIVAVEPVAAMRSVLVDKVPAAGVVAGIAEALPLAQRSVDVVVAAQAFHWFRVPEALSEVARVLRPGGGLALLWNDRDVTEPWVAELSALIRWDDRPVPSYADVDWVRALTASGSFEGIETRRFRFEQLLDVETLVDRVLSTSYIAAQPEAERQILAGRVRRLAAGRPGPLLLPYLTDLILCHRCQPAPPR